MALQPTKLLLGLLMLLLIYFGGVTLDFVWGQQQDEMFGEYRVFDRVVQSELTLFKEMTNSAVRLELGLNTLTGDELGGGMFGALKRMVINVPAWMGSNHPWFFLLLGGYALAIKMLLGGAIARLAVMQACRGTTAGLFEAAQFTWPRAVWFITGPLIPLMVAGVIWLVLAVSGWALFNLPGLDVLGGLLFGVMLFGGFIAAGMLVFTALGAAMLPSALAVEGTDAFDVISRVFTFLIYRPMRYLVLLAVVLVYGAMTYLVVGAVVFLTLWFTLSAAGVWVGDFDQVAAAPRLGEPLAAVDTDTLDGTQKAASWLIRVWSALLFGVSIAYAVSYFFTAQTWMYLLLRREVDGTTIEDCYDEPAASPTPPDAPPAEKIEPDTPEPNASKSDTSDADENPDNASS